MATTKHLVANNQEHDRAFTDAVVGKRTLREIYRTCIKPIRMFAAVSKPRCAKPRRLFSA
jgi:hypothetical protein